MSRAEVKELFVEKEAFNEGASKAIFEGLNDLDASISVNTNAAQKKVAFAQAGTSMLNDITKLHSGSKGNSEWLSSGERVLYHRKILSMEINLIDNLNDQQKVVKVDQYISFVVLALLEDKDE